MGRIQFLVAQLVGAVAAAGASEAQVSIRPGERQARVYVTFDVPEQSEPQPEPPAPEPPPPAAPAAAAVPVPSPAPEPAPSFVSLMDRLRQLGQAANDSDPYPPPHLRYPRSEPFWCMAQSASQAVG